MQSNRKQQDISALIHQQYPHSVHVAMQATKHSQAALIVAIFLLGANTQSTYKQRHEEKSTIKHAFATLSACYSIMSL